jgi:hypothetical protein
LISDGDILEVDILTLGKPAIDILTQHRGSNNFVAINSFVGSNNSVAIDNFVDIVVRIKRDVSVSEIRRMQRQN